MQQSLDWNIVHYDHIIDQMYSSFVVLRPMCTFCSSSSLNITRVLFISSSNVQIFFIPSCFRSFKWIPRDIKYSLTFKFSHHLNIKVMLTLQHRGHCILHKHCYLRCLLRNTGTYKRLSCLQNDSNAHLTHKEKKIVSSCHPVGRQYKKSELFLTNEPQCLSFRRQL